MSFLLRILFSGLIAVVPSEDGTELTVLLLNVDHGYETSDGLELAHHKPLLIARAGNCTGQCPTEDAAIAAYLYSDKTTSAAAASLAEATSGGGAWALSGSDLSIVKGSSTDPALPALVYRTNVRGTVNGNPKIIPTTSSEREDFTWIADLDQICPSCEIDQSVLGSQPPAIVAARLRLRSGNVFTYSVARIGGNVTPVHFKRLDGTGSESAYTQSVASWMAADIEISGDSVEIVEEKFDNSTGRSMTLTPDANDKVEIAVLNLPPFVPPASSTNPAADPGKHFEMYYDLAQTPPAQAARLVPRAGAATGAPSYAEVNWQTVHPSESVWSDLLNKLRLEIGRGPYDQLLCPIGKENTP